MSNHNDHCSMESCTCRTCVSYCLCAPGWMSPVEAEMAIENGYAPKMMIDWWQADPNIYVLAPAVVGCEGSRAPTWDEMAGGDFIRALLGECSKGPCTLLQSSNRCGIHDSGFKPTQCRTAWHGDKDDKLFVDNEAVSKMWDTDNGRAVIEKWKKAVEFDDRLLNDVD